MPIRLGINPIGWSNDDLRTLGGDTKLETCLAEARQAGFSGIELGHKFPRDAATLRPLLDAHGLALVSGWYSTALLHHDAPTELAAMRPHLSLLQALGCKVVIIAETSNAIHTDRAIPLSRRPVLSDADWPRFADRLTALGDTVAAEGLALAYHHHMGTVVQTGEEIDRLMAQCGGGVKLLLDTGHATFAGADPATLARRHRDRIVHVHCKDIRQRLMQTAQAADWSFLDSVVAGVFTVPGDGMVNFWPVLAALPDYAGWLVVEAEQDPLQANPLVYARLGHDHLAGYARRAGLL
jgi:inosose dehydratase